MATKLYRRLTGMGANHLSKYTNKFVSAVVDGNMEETRKLIKGKIKIAVPMIWYEHGEEEVYPIHVACAKGSLDIVKLMFRHGATLENKTASGYTPLHFACCYNNTHPEVTEHLLDMGARPNAKDKLKGQTPFHKACLSNNYGAAKRLMSYVKPTVKDNEGRTAIDIAIDNDCDQIVALFEDYDAESRRQEELRQLPERLEQLEKTTDAIIRNRSLQSLQIQDTRLRKSSGYNSTDGLHSYSPVTRTSVSDLISLHTDGGHMDGCPSLRPITSSMSSLTSTQVKVPLVPDPTHRFTFPGEKSACSMPVLSLQTNRQSFSPVRSTFPESIQEEMPESPCGQLNRLQRNQVQRNYSMLQSMMKPERIITKLFAKFHIDLDTKEKIASMSTQEKNDYILSHCILRGTNCLYNDFLTILRDTQQCHLAERLERYEESPVYRRELIERREGPKSIHRESTV